MGGFYGLQFATVMKKQHPKRNTRQNKMKKIYYSTIIPRQSSKGLKFPKAAGDISSALFVASNDGNENINVATIRFCGAKGTICVFKKTNILTNETD